MGGMSVHESPACSLDSDSCIRYEGDVAAGRRHRIPGLAAALAAFLVSSFFVASPIATVVAAIVVKRLGNSALDEICKKSDEWIKQMG